MQMYRAPICTAIGAVDAGKTTLLDRLRNTHVQDKEAGGITQKIGVTFFTQDVLSQLSKSLNKPIFIPGLLLVDTPGHDCFTNQRLSGIEISDLVIVVIDIFKGIEPQTIEILKLLKKNKTPFCVAANKVDRLYKWSPPTPNAKNLRSLKISLTKQSEYVKKLLDEKLTELVIQFAESGLNALPYYKNTDPKTFISIIPVSSKTGEGIPDLVLLLDLLTKKFMKKKIEWTPNSNAHGFILEKMKDKLAGDFYTIVLTNGTLNHGDMILAQAENGEVIDCKIKQLMIPKEGVEIKDNYHFDYIRQADQAKSYLIRLDTDATIMSASKFHCYTVDEKQNLIDEMVERYSKKQELVMNKEFKTPGIQLCTPTLGTAEALYRLCTSHKIPISGITIGNLNKKILMKATVTREIIRPETVEEKIYYNRYNCVIVFEKDVPAEMEKMAIQSKIKLIHHDIIYRLIEGYEAFCQESNEKLQTMHPNLLPRCELKVLSQFIFMKRNPILMGVKVVKNKLYPNMIIQACTETKPHKRQCILGKVVSVQKNNKTLQEAETGEEVCVKFVPLANSGKIPEYNHDFNENSRLVSYYTKEELELFRKFPNVFRQ
jgi:translation initiation factor 5B